jgi:hypothetical protein
VTGERIPSGLKIKRDEIVNQAAKIDLTPRVVTKSLVPAVGSEIEFTTELQDIAVGGIEHRALKPSRG